MNSDRITCPGCGLVRPTREEFDAMTQTEFAAYASRPCCNPACGGRWGTGCWHCHHPNFADGSQIDRAILAGVERWARARKIYGHALVGMTVPDRDELPESAENIDRWIIQVVDGSSIPKTPATVRIAELGDGVVRDVQCVDYDTALLAALCIEGGHTLDVGRCTACEARGLGKGRKLATHGWSSRIMTVSALVSSGIAPENARWAEEHPSRDGWELGAYLSEDGHERVYVASRPCSTCKANSSYRDVQEAARLVLDEAREAVEVLATRLQADGDKLGEWLVLWLAGRNGCVCNTNPDTTDGPDIDCPIHGESGAPPWQPAAIAALVRSTSE